MTVSDDIKEGSSFEGMKRVHGIEWSAGACSDLGSFARENITNEWFINK